jgi:general secretion pathway protein H
MSATGRAGDAGSTLIEMLVVVAILGAITVLTWPQLAGVSRRAALSRDRGILISDLRWARAQAARTGRSVSLQISPDARGYDMADVQLRRFARERLDGAPGVLTFLPDGSSEGGRWRLVGDGGSLAAVVEPGVGLVIAAR